jgi:hypothetical protein
MNTRKNLRRQLQDAFDKIKFICDLGDCCCDAIDALDLAGDAYALAWHDHLTGEQQGREFPIFRDEIKKEIEEILLAYVTADLSSDEAGELVNCSTAFCHTFSKLMDQVVEGWIEEDQALAKRG